MRTKNCLPWMAALALAGAGARQAAADDLAADLTPIPKGILEKVGNYMPQRLNLALSQPPGIKKQPAYAGKPLYGTLSFGSTEGSQVFIVLDEKADASEAKLYVDTNRDGDLTNEPGIALKRDARKVKNPQTGAEFENIIFSGPADLKVSADEKAVPVSLSFYRFAPETAKGRGLPSNLLLYFRDYGQSGKITLGGKEYPILLLDERASGRYDKTEHGEREGARVMLLIDRDGNGKFTRPGETYDLSQPFALGGTTYEAASIAPDGSKLTLKVSDKKVAEIPLIAPGQPALAFAATTLEGRKVKFPADYKGKLVLLDFWATWCGPCLGEIPHLVAAYKKYNSRGFEILGVSLDQSDQAAQVKKFLKDKNMSWSQVYDGKFWQAEVAQMYGVQSIPRAILVDGTTGKIVEDGQNLRGETLDETISKSLAEMKTASK